MQLLVVIIALHQLVIDVHRAPLKLCHDRRREGLLVVAIVEGTVGDSHVGFCIMSVTVLTIAVKKSQSCYEVSLFEEVTGVGQSEFVLHSGFNRKLVEILTCCFCAAA